MDLKGSGPGRGERGRGEPLCCSKGFEFLSKRDGQPLEGSKQVRDVKIIWKGWSCRPVKDRPLVQVGGGAGCERKTCKSCGGCARVVSEH